MKALRCEKLTLAIGSRVLVNELTLQLGAGECWGILGPNGAGKTTLLHTLAGLREPRDGLVYVDDTPLDAMSGLQRARQIGIMFQHYDDVFPATVYETVAVGRYPHHAKFKVAPDDPARVTEALGDADLGGYEHRMIDTLSGGERRRVALATLLAQDTRVLLLDEPANHLDLKHQIGLYTLVSEKARGGNRTVVMVMHDVNMAARYCSHVLLLDGTGNWQSGRSAALLTAQTLSALYGYPLTQVPSERGAVFVPG